MFHQWYAFRSEIPTELIKVVYLVDVDGRDDQPGLHAFKSLIIGGQGPYVPFPSHSFLSYLGPKCYILLLDCRYAP